MSSSTEASSLRSTEHTHARISGELKAPKRLALPRQPAPAPRALCQFPRSTTPRSLFSTRLPDIPSPIHLLLVLQARREAGAQYSLPPPIRPSPAREGIRSDTSALPSATLLTRLRDLRPLPHAQQYVLRVVPCRKNPFNQLQRCKGRFHVNNSSANTCRA